MLLGNQDDLQLIDPEYSPVARGPYSDPRADIMMFFTQRAVPSAAPDPNQPNSAYARGVKLSPLEVVYGHAALGEPVWSDADNRYYMPLPDDPNIRHITETEVFNSSSQRSLIPAAKWHLTRRATIIEPDPNVSNPQRDVYSEQYAQPTGQRHVDGFAAR